MPRRDGTETIAGIAVAFLRCARDLVHDWVRRSANVALKRDGNVAAGRSKPIYRDLLADIPGNGTPIKATCRFGDVEDLASRVIWIVLRGGLLCLGCKRQRGGGGER